MIEDNSKNNNDSNTNIIKEKKILDNSDASVVYDSPNKNDNDENKEINNESNNNNENINKGFNLKIKTADGKEENWNIQS